MEMKLRTKDLDRAFLRLPKSTRNKALRPALTEGAKVVQAAAKINAKAVSQKEVTGTLVRNIVVRAARNYRGSLRRVVQIRKNAKHPSKTDKNGAVRVATYAAVLEYGKQGQPPRSWLRKAQRERTSEAIAEVRREANKRMAQAVMDARR